MILSSRDSGRTIETKAGSTLTIRLEENPTTGYRWIIDELPAGIRKRDDRFIPGENIGAAGTREFVFSPDRPGLHRLSLKKIRPWEKAAPPLETFEITLAVEGSR